MTNQSIWNRYVKRFLKRRPSLYSLLLGNTSLFFARVLIYTVNSLVFIGMGLHGFLIATIGLLLIDAFLHIHMNYFLYENILIENQLKKGIYNI